MNNEQWIISEKRCRAFLLYKLQGGFSGKDFTLIMPKEVGFYPLMNVVTQQKTNHNFNSSAACFFRIRRVIALTALYEQYAIVGKLKKA